MATIQVQKMQIKRTLDEISFIHNGKTTAINLSTDINRRLSMETTTETSGRK